MTWVGAGMTWEWRGWVWIPAFAGMTWEGAGVAWVGAGMTGRGRVPCGWRMGCGGRIVFACVRTRRTVAAFLGEFLVCARAGVNKRNARTRVSVEFCRIL